MTTLSRMHNRKGQSAIEMLFYGGMIAAGLTGMAFYVNRAYQGYLYSTGSAHGPQFDYNNDAWQYQQQLNVFNQHQEITIVPSSGGPTVDLPQGNNDLPSIPGGRVPGRRLETKSEVNSFWDIRRNGHYEAQ